MLANSTLNHLKILKYIRRNGYDKNKEKDPYGGRIEAVEGMVEETG